MEWRKSNFSAASGNCVEVRQDLAAIRDSKNAGGPALGAGVVGLLAIVKSGKLDR